MQFVPRAPPTILGGGEFSLRVFTNNQAALAACSRNPPPGLSEKDIVEKRATLLNIETAEGINTETAEAAGSYGGFGCTPSTFSHLGPLRTKKVMKNFAASICKLGDMSEENLADLSQRAAEGYCHIMGR